MKIDVIIRVYDRIEDLINNLRVIRETWTSNDYNIVVVSNGFSKGYVVPDDISPYVNKLVVLKDNAGHLKGNSQLLLEGLRVTASSQSKYTIILEADTWLYGDWIINKYCHKLEEEHAVWASARWYDRFYSLATDFAIIESAFLKENPKILDFDLYPECAVTNFLLDRKKKYVLIRENMNVMLPSYIKKFSFAPQGRFFVFPKSRMVTHHIESIKGGMNQKKKEFNVVCGSVFFKEVNSYRFPFFIRLMMRFSHMLDKLLLRRSWYSKRCIHKI